MPLTNDDVSKYRTRARRGLRMVPGIRRATVDELVDGAGRGISRVHEVHTLFALFAVARWLFEVQPARWRILASLPCGVVILGDTPDGVVRVFLSGIPSSLASRVLGAKLEGLVSDEIEAQNSAVCWLRVLDNDGSVALDEGDVPDDEPSEAEERGGLLDALTAVMATAWALVKPARVGAKEAA